METFYQHNGAWHPSEWENGRRHVTREDGHTYTSFADGSVGHIYCDCFHAE